MISPERYPARRLGATGSPGDVGRTYLDHIQGNAVLGYENVEVAPAVSEARLAKGSLLHLAHVDNVGNVVLLDSGETLTAHRRGYHALEEALSQVDFIAVITNAANENTKEVAGSFVHSMALLDGDVRLHVPGEFGESADETLKGTLRALLRERRLTLC